MSRTFRRKRSKNQYQRKSGRSHFEHHWTHDREDPDPITMANFSRYAWACFKKVPLEGKAFDKAFWKFHGDTGYWGGMKVGRQIAEDRYRMENKMKLYRVWKDADYEFIEHNPRCLSWDRW